MRNLHITTIMTPDASENAFFNDVEPKCNCRPSFDDLKDVCFNFTLCRDCHIRLKQVIVSSNRSLRTKKASYRHKAYMSNA